MIKPSLFTQQMIDLQRTAFLSLYKAASTMQKQANSAMDLMLNQAPWIPSEGHQAISDWLGTCQQEGDRFKTYVEKSFDNLGMYFSPKAVAKTKKAVKPSAAKAKKAAAAAPKKVVVKPPKKTAVPVTKKAAPVETKSAKTIPAEKATPVETKPAKTIPAKKADVLKKEDNTVLK